MPEDGWCVNLVLRPRREKHMDFTFSLSRIKGSYAHIMRN